MNEATSTVAPAAVSGAPITTLLRVISVPAIGTHWIEQGGIFLGILPTPAGDTARILPVDPRAYFEDRTWGAYGTDVTAAKHPTDGRGNTQAMADAGSELAKEILALEIAGFNDLHLATRLDLQLARACAIERFDQKDWYLTSEQYSPDGAWVQDFEDGYSSINSKGYEVRAVAVRSFIL